jgi:hypothetical protein
MLPLERHDEASSNIAPSQGCSPLLPGTNRRVTRRRVVPGFPPSGIPIRILVNQQPKGDSMFEYDQHIVDALLSESADFQRLYRKHVELKQQVHDANARANLMDDMTLENLKKEKLLIKDKMAAIIEEYRRDHA